MEENPYDDLIHEAIRFKAAGDYARAIEVSREVSARALARGDMRRLYFTNALMAECYGALQDFESCERLLKAAMQIYHQRPQDFSDAVPIAFTTLVQLYTHQERYSEIEEFVEAEAKFHATKYGDGSPEHFGYLSALAEVYSAYTEKFDEALTIRRRLVQAAKDHGDLYCIKEELIAYEECLREAGLEQEADKVRFEMAQLRDNDTHHQTRFSDRLAYLRNQLAEGEINQQEFRSQMVEEVAGRALDDSPLLEEMNTAYREAGLDPHEPEFEEHWKDACAEIIEELSITDEEVIAAGRKIIAAVTDNAKSFREFWDGT